MKIIQNKCLKDFSSIKIGGKSKIFIEINSLNDFKKAIKYCNKYDLKYRTIGEGTSIYFSEYFDGAILYNRFKYFRIVESYFINKNSKENILLIASGTKVEEIVKYYQSINQTEIIKKNIEILKYIEGTIGGAIYKNTYNICDLLEGCTILKNKNIKFYRSNNFHYNNLGSNLKFSKEKDNILITLFINLSKKINYNLINENINLHNENINNLYLKNVFQNIYFENGVIYINELFKNINFKKINNDKIEIINNIILKKKNITPVELNKFINNIKLIFMDFYGLDLILNIECI